MKNVESNNKLRNLCIARGLYCSAAALILVVAALLTGCVKEPMETCGSTDGPDDGVVVGFRPGTLTIAGSSSGSDGWNSARTKSVSEPTTRAALPPDGMVEGAFQIGDLWVDGNCGRGVEKEMTWAQATTYCENRGLRLPTYDEMAQIIQYAKANAPLPDNRKFEFWNLTWSETSYRYWTSTPRSSTPNYVWQAYMPATSYNLYAMDGWNASDGEECTARCVKLANELPPAPDPGPEVEHPDNMKTGTTFRVLVYAAGDDPQQSTPIDQNTYKVADALGNVVVTAVDEQGNATDGDTRELVLRRGAYDFYYFSPAVPANVGMPLPGTYTSLINGVDYMALVQRQIVDPSQGKRHYIPEVCFYRMASYVDIRIRPKEGEIMGTLQISDEGLQLIGLPSTGFYEIGEYPYGLFTEGRGGMMRFPGDCFDFDDDQLLLSTAMGSGRGRAVLPGYVEELRVDVTLTSDGKTQRCAAKLSNFTFEPGYRYTVDLAVSRIADKPQLDITILPWSEYDWGDMGIGGNYNVAVGSLYGGGVVYYVDDIDQTDFRVIAMDESTPLSYSYLARYVLGSAAQQWDANDGSSVQLLAKEYSENTSNGTTGNFATDFPAFSYCYEKTDGGVPKGTWYVPSVIELNLLLSSNRNLVNNAIYSSNGTVIQNKIYRSCNEYNGNTSNAWSVDFQTSGKVYGNKENASAVVRCVRKKQGK